MTPDPRTPEPRTPDPRTPDPFAPATLGPLRLRNRILKAATYEGLARRSRVTQELVAFHRRMAAGGVALTTVAYCAVAPAGRTDRQQLLWEDDALPGMRRLTEAVHAEGAAASAQIGHAGPVGDARGNRLPALSASRRFVPAAGSFTRAATVQQIGEMPGLHARAARLAEQAGFDAVEVHLGHNYLASSFLSPRLNRRRDQWGGSLENRARLARDILRAVREAVGDRLAIIAKHNMEDGVRGGLQVEESLQVARWIDQDGTADALELTAGSSLLNPMYLFRGAAPLREFAAVMPPPVRLGVRLFGRTLLREYPYREGFLLAQAELFRAALGTPVVALGGISSRATIEQAMAAGFGFVALGRALLHEPDLVRRMAAEPGARSGCTHCNRCMPTTYTGTRCVLTSGAGPRTPDWASGRTVVGG